MSDEADAGSNPASESAPVNDVAPAQTEQHIEQAQPEAPEQKPAASAREAVERAFAKVEATPEKALENPVKSDKTRDETGKFAKPDATQAKPVAPVKPDAQQQPIADVTKAPAGFTKAGQDGWAQTPPAVKLDTERRLTELTQGIEKYKSVAEPVLKYHDMAAQSGTTLEKALDAYVGIETLWRKNPVQGFNEVCRNMAVDPRQMLQAIAHGMNGQPVQQPNNEVLALRQQLAQFEQKFGTLEKTFTETQQQTKQRAAETAVEAFAKDNPHFDEVSDSIAQMLETGFAKDLPDAYAKSIRLNPEVMAKVEAEKTLGKPNSAQTRAKAAISITGAPSSGSTPETRNSAGSAREAVEKAFASVGLR